MIEIIQRTRNRYTYFSNVHVLRILNTKKNKFLKNKKDKLSKLSIYQY